MMSVATMLGVDDVDGHPMSRARAHWAGWTSQEAPLAVVDDLLDLPGWTREADQAAKDDALRALAKLGSASGADDAAATTALTWMLVPGAATVAFRLSDLAVNIDELVATHLWVAARTFAWDRRRCTAASILRDTRRAVLAEVGVGDGARRVDRTWVETVCVEPASPAWSTLVGSADDIGADPGDELGELLQDALRAGVIDTTDRALLLELATAADRPDPARRRPAHRGRSGLLATAATEVVADRWGMSARSVKRRAGRSIDRLAAFSINGHAGPGPGPVGRPQQLAASA